MILTYEFTKAVTITQRYTRLSYKTVTGSENENLLYSLKVKSVSVKLKNYFLKTTDSSLSQKPFLKSKIKNAWKT